MWRHTEIKMIFSCNRQLTIKYFMVAFLCNNLAQAGFFRNIIHTVVNTVGDILNDVTTGSAHVTEMCKFNTVNTVEFSAKIGE